MGRGEGCCYFLLLLFHHLLLLLLDNIKTYMSMTNKYKDDQYKQPTKSHGYKSSDKEELLVLKERGRLPRDAEVSIDGQVHGLEQVLCPPFVRLLTISEYCNNSEKIVYILT